MHTLAKQATVKNLDGSAYPYQFALGETCMYPTGLPSIRIGVVRSQLGYQTLFVSWLLEGHEHHFLKGSQLFGSSGARVASAPADSKDGGLGTTFDGVRSLRLDLVDESALELRKK